MALEACTNAMFSSLDSLNLLYEYHGFDGPLPGNNAWDSDDQTNALLTSFPPFEANLEYQYTQDGVWPITEPLSVPQNNLLLENQPGGASSHLNPLANFSFREPPAENCSPLLPSTIVSDADSGRGHIIFQDHFYQFYVDTGPLAATDSSHAYFSNSIAQSSSSGSLSMYPTLSQSCREASPSSILDDPTPIKLPSSRVLPKTTTAHNTSRKRDGKRKRKSEPVALRTCNDCGMVFSRWKDTQRHRTAKHEELNSEFVRQSTCVLCLKVFARPDTVKRHMNRSTLECKQRAELRVQSGDLPREVFREHFP